MRIFLKKAHPIAFAGRFDSLCTLTVRRPLQTSSCPSVCFGAYGGATVLRSHSVGVRNLSAYFFSASMTACGMETSRSAKVIFAPSEAFASATTM